MILNDIDSLQDLTFVQVIDIEGEGMVGTLTPASSISEVSPGVYRTVVSFNVPYVIDFANQTLSISLDYAADGEGSSIEEVDILTYQTSISPVSPTGVIITLTAPSSTAITLTPPTPVPLI